MAESLACFSQQFQDPDFGSLSGGRVVRIAVHPDYQGVTCPTASPACCDTMNCSCMAHGSVGWVSCGATSCSVVEDLASSEGVTGCRAMEVLQLPVRTYEPELPPVVAFCHRRPS